MKLQNKRKRKENDLIKTYDGNITENQYAVE